MPVPIGRRFVIPSLHGKWPGVSITILTISLTKQSLVHGRYRHDTVPTSLVILAAGRWLGAAPVTTPSPPHAAQGPTWPLRGSRFRLPTVHCPGPCWRGSLGTFARRLSRTASSRSPLEVVFGTPAIFWSNLKPGTYLIESGTHPSIQGAMGLYAYRCDHGAHDRSYCRRRVLQSGAAVVNYDSELPLVLSETMRHRAVNSAVGRPDSARRKCGIPAGQCGDLPPSATSIPATANTCYPPAVNYDPRYFLSWVSGSRAGSPVCDHAGGATGSVLVASSSGLAHACLPLWVRSRRPAAVPGVSLIAEDHVSRVPKGPVRSVPGAARTQDVLDNDPRSAVVLAVFDRHLSLSTDNRRGGGMMAISPARRTWW